jgi:hypothetical protein
MKNRIVVSIVLATICCACGGGGGGDGGAAGGRYAPATSRSFSPITAQDARGNTTPLFWRYRVNGGQPLALSIEGGAVQAVPGDLVVSIDPGELVRKVSYGAALRGSVDGTKISGNVNVGIAEQVRLGGATLIASDTLGLSAALKGGGDSARLQLSVVLDYTPAYEWFLDRDDLDQLPIGYVSTQSVSAHATASGALRFDGESEPIGPEEISAVDTERWTVTATMDEVSVSGRVYRDIVVVERSAAAGVGGFSGGDVQNIFITYWVAKGVGIVHSEGEFQLLDTPLVIDLVETNLVAPS